LLAKSSADGPSKSGHSPDGKRIEGCEKTGVIIKILR